ncbi:MAG: hypothetical protein ACI9NC_001463 [Verrucomicrobiales bacterium]|jgi:hypothetical protein
MSQFPNVGAKSGSVLNVSRSVRNVWVKPAGSEKGAIDSLFELPPLVGSGVKAAGVPASVVETVDKPSRINIMYISFFIYLYAVIGESENWESGGGRRSVGGQSEVSRRSVGGQSEVGGRRSEVGGRRSEVGGRRSEVGVGKCIAQRRRDAETQRRRDAEARMRAACGSERWEGRRASRRGAEDFFWRRTRTRPLLGVCFLRGVPEDVVEGIGEGEKGGCGRRVGEVIAE